MSMRRFVAVTAVSCVALAVPSGASAGIKISSATLYPHFRPAAQDYTVRCDTPVRVRVRTTGETEARIGKRHWTKKTQQATLPLAPDAGVRVHKRNAKGRGKTYSLRCLPDNIPSLEFHRYREPEAPFYLLTPNSTGASAFNGGYAMVLTPWGAPIWWYQDSPSPFDAKVLPDGTFAWAHFHGGFVTDPTATYDLRRPNGKLVKQIRAVGSPTDEHDLQLTADGNYMLITYRRRDHVDTSAFNGDSDASIYDCIVQVIRPDGSLVSEWSTYDHVGLDEVPAYRWALLTDKPYDAYHMNAVDPLPSGDFLISLRHTDAVYRVDGATGAIEWKLGGSTTPQSLTVEGDTMASPLQAQHDVRWLGHGEISVHDNGATNGRTPRVVRFKIDGGVARLEESFSDPATGLSICCGSARLLGKDWLVSWGGTAIVGEYDQRHRPVFTFKLPPPGTSYRAIPIMTELSAKQLRHGMDVQARSAGG
jgi:hypothetical protein